jgi:CheY-like chemotaxis protein
MWVESPSSLVKQGWRGPGSTFYFTTQLERHMEESTDVYTLKGLETLDGFRVLILSDSKPKGQQLQKLIFQWEMSPRLFLSVEDAAKVIKKAQKQKHPFQLILIECKDDKTNFPERIRELKQEPRSSEPYIIVISAAKDENYYLHQKEMGINYYLKHPAKPSEILDAILGLVSGKLDLNFISGQTTNGQDILGEDVLPLHILLVEDNSVNQKIGIRMLQNMGHHVSLACHGREAIEKWESKPYDMIIMDIQMPEMDGFEATFQIRKKEKLSGNHIPIIALTAHAMKGDRERCLASGMDGYASKPLKADTLGEEIKRLAPNVLSIKNI